MKPAKIGAIGLLYLNSLAIANGKHPENQSENTRDTSKSTIPAIQTNNFTRKSSIGYDAVVNPHSFVSNTENKIGYKGLPTDDRISRKGNIGYHAVVDPFTIQEQESVLGFKSCINHNGDLIRFKELSDRRVLTGKWQSRKGRIGYYSVNAKTNDHAVSCYAIAE